MRGFHLIRPRSRSYQEPGEICFVYKPPDDQKKSGKDPGWVLIVDGNGKIVYPKGPFIRASPNFFTTLIDEGRVARWRVFYRPMQCEKYILLVHGKALKSYFWHCVLHFWDRSHIRRFDDLRKPLPPEVVESRLAGRKERRKNREKLRDEERDPFFAFKLRMKHPRKKPEIPPSDILF